MKASQIEFHGTLEKIRVNRSSTQEELRRYRKCGLFLLQYEIYKTSWIIILSNTSNKIK
jgi:hypothetical protein